VTSLLDILSVEPQGHDMFLGSSSGMIQHLFGGQLLGQSVVAAARTVEGREINSLHGYFLHAGDGRRPVQYEVQRTRDGRSFSSRRVVGYQDDHKIWTADLSFHTGEAGIERAEEQPPSLAPEELPSFMDGMRSTVGTGSEWNDLDIRWGGPWPPAGRAPAGMSPRNSFWFRFSKELPDDDAVLHAAVLAYVSDLSFLTPVILPDGAFMWSPGVRATSLDHAVWFHRSFSVDEWLLYDQYSPVASRGRGFAIGGISAIDRGRVASTAQEGLFRFKNEVR